MHSCRAKSTSVRPVPALLALQTYPPYWSLQHIALDIDWTRCKLDELRSDGDAIASERSQVVTLLQNLTPASRLMVDFSSARELTSGHVSVKF
ncbi:hypothetical protein EXIGLDRAFT_727724 [Exidia glandulosa HHB12029]|uniref:Uncharacterized protein n=1 Tax=Exidia glandulosa HHB12029 TaxID=1314781 RepID=A0A165D8K3_EXIGL|nr:hypothetical protein EXIGLDRAFT_727724 [Exidia glandulosa HHB12029]